MNYESKWTDRKKDVLDLAALVKSQHPNAWDEVKVPGQPSRRFINLVSLACLAAGIPGGVNLKRGGPQQSLDALAFPNDTGARDSTGTYPGVEIIDIVGGAEGPNPSLGWTDVTQVTIESGNPGGWKAGSLAGATKPASSFPSYEALGGDEGAKKITRKLEQDYQRAGRPGLDGDCGGWLRRTDYDVLSGKIKTVDESIIAHRDEWLDALGLIRVEHGMMANAYICTICNASVGVEKSKPVPPIPHTAECSR